MQFHHPPSVYFISFPIRSPISLHSDISSMIYTVLFPTIPPNESSGPNSGPTQLINNLYGPGDFTSTDWILASIILVILIGIVIFCYCCIKRKLAAKNSSGISKKSGINQSEMTSVSRFNSNPTTPNHVRPKVGQSFGSAHELPKIDTVAFEAAVAGVALTKQDTNIDIGTIYHMYMYTPYTHKSTKPNQTPQLHHRKISTTMN